MAETLSIQLLNSFLFLLHELILKFFDRQCEQYEHIAARWFFKSKFNRPRDATDSSAEQHKPLLHRTRL